MAIVEKIKMKNFKSFTNTVIPFTPGYVVIIGPNGSGKCLEYSSKVMLSDGSRVKIGEIVEEAMKVNKTVAMDDGFFTISNKHGIRVLSLDPSSMKIEPVEVSSFIKRTSPSFMLKIKTKSGREIISTPYHPFFTIKKGLLKPLKAEEMDEGVFIAVPRIIPVANSSQKINFLSFFKPSDNVFAGHSKEIDSFFFSLKKKLGKHWIKRVSEETKVPITVIKGFADGQAMNVAFLRKILEHYNKNAEEFVKKIKPKTSSKYCKAVWEMTPELARLLGYVISEGTVRGNQVRIINSDKKVVKDFVSTSAKAFGVKAKVFNYKNNYEDAIIFSRSVCSVLEKVFSFSGPSSAKKAPPIVFKSSDGIISAFLGSLFSGDGYVHCDGSVYLEYSTASKQLARDVQLLLLRLGVISLVREREKYASNTKSKKKRKYYSVMIYGVGNVKKFAEKVKLVGAKQEKLRLIKRMKSKNNPNLDLIPNSNMIVKELVKKAGLRVKANRKEHPRLASYYENRSLMSREGILEVLKTVGNNRLKEYALLEKLATSHVYWDEIVEIKRFKPRNKWVYDLSIQGHHNFIADGFFAHNSNILDSLCFAIGASSMKHLRAERLSDLVNHKSKDKTAFVEVSFRDKGGELHSVSRAIDSKGVSVFRLNGKRTTKFQIEELLHSMNVHADGHNIILQGDVTRVVRMTPMQRRQFLDEISGIAEYEIKKQEAGRELEKVETKIRDASLILSEREGYLRTLEKEKIEAEVYLKLREEEKQLQASLVKKELASVETTFSNLLKFVSTAKDDLKEFLNEKKELEKNLEEINNQIDALTEEIFRESNKKQSGARREVEEVKARLLIIEEKMKDLDAKREELKKAKQGIKEEIERVSKQIKEKEKELKQLGKEEDSLLKELHEVQRKLESLAKKTGMPAGFDEAFKKIDELDRKISKQSHEMKRIELEIASNSEVLKIKKAALENSRKEVKAFEEKKKEFDEKIRKLEDKKREAEEELKKLLREKEKLFENEKHDNESLRKIDNKLVLKKKELARMNARISTAKNIVELKDAAKAVLNAGIPGVIGAVRDLCSYSQQYAAALETAAGPRLFYVVTETAASAAEAVKYLKKNKLGRVSFIPLDRIKPTKPGKEIKEIAKKEGVIGLAIDLVRYDKKHAPALEFVFGDTLIVKDIDIVKRIGVGKARMVTLDADVAEYSGLVTGGFFKHAVRQADLKELDLLEQEVENLEEDKKAVIANLQSLREKMNETSEKKSKAEVRLKEAEILLSEMLLRKKESEKQQPLAEDEKQVNNLELSIKKLLVKKQEAESELNKLMEEKIKLKQEISVPDIEKFSKEIKETEANASELKEKLNALEIKKGSITAEIEKILLEKIKMLEKQEQENDRKVGMIEQELRNMEKQRAEFEVVLKEKENKARELASSMKELFKKKEEMEKERNKLMQDIGSLNRKIDEVRDKMSEKQIEKAKIEEKYAELKRKWEKYKEVRTLQLSKAKLEEKLEQVEKQLETIGSVNLKAVEMYKEYEEEIKGIKEKKQKLTEEKQSILNMIDEIDKRKVEAFAETFHAINKNFNKYFKELYPESGSEARLALEKPEEPMAGGLFIKAKRGNKQIKSIDSLSGGEKTLTAIAFLFAVQAYNPSPFYVLDEIDAALDAENAERVASMIKKFSKTTQFILITHNAMVTRKADQIIGVHMNKEGSSIVELNLKKYQAMN